MSFARDNHLKEGSIVRFRVMSNNESLIMAKVVSV